MSKVFALGAKVMCNNIVGLVGTQLQLCRDNPDVMTSIGKGAKLGVEQCQEQFKFERWNCSTIDHDSSVFGKVMRRCEYKARASGRVCFVLAFMWLESRVRRFQWTIINSTGKTMFRHSLEKAVMTRPKPKA